MTRQEEQNTESWKQFRSDAEEFEERLDERFEERVRERGPIIL
jgi:hypothetical protein